MDIYHFLTSHSIPYERADHPAVYTCEEAERLVPPLPGAETKNLVVRDKKGSRHFLVVVGYEKTVDLKALSPLLDVNGLSFASPERLMKYLGIEPGSVSLLAIINDTQCAVEVIVDEKLWQADVLKCHPLVNTSTLAIRRVDIEKILTVTGHRWRMLSVPGILKDAD
jgi:Ala-tRNA(Pro) deacylase